MSDEIQGNEPSSTEPSAPVASVEEGKPIENGSPVVSTTSPVVQDAPVADAPVISSPTVEAGNVAAAVEGGAPVTGVVAAVGGDAELAASHAEWTSNVQPASALADQISEHVSALEGSGDTFVSRVASDVKRLVDQIKAAL